MSSPIISQELEIEMLEKLPNGDYAIKYPATKVEQIIDFKDEIDKLKNGVILGRVVPGEMIFKTTTNGSSIPSGTSVMTKMNEFKMGMGGTYRVSISIRNLIPAQIYVDGVPKGIQRTIDGTYDEDITIEAGNSIEIWGKPRTGFTGYLDAVEIKVGAPFPL